MCSDIIQRTDFNNCVFVCTILQVSATIVKCDFDIGSKSKAIPQKYYQARSTYLDLCKKNVNTFLRKLLKYLHLEKEFESADCCLYANGEVLPD